MRDCFLETLRLLQRCSLAFDDSSGGRERRFGLCRELYCYLLQVAVAERLFAEDTLYIHNLQVRYASTFAVVRKRLTARIGIYRNHCRIFWLLLPTSNRLKSVQLSPSCISVLVMAALHRLLEMPRCMCSSLSRMRRRRWRKRSAGGAEDQR